jgi:hypothetical protein
MKLRTQERQESADRGARFDAFNIRIVVLRVPVVIPIEELGPVA